MTTFNITELRTPSVELNVLTVEQKTFYVTEILDTMKEGSEGVEQGIECQAKDDLHVHDDEKPSREEADEKVAFLEKQLSTQRRIVEEHQAKIHLLEDLIKRQCLLLKENDDAYITYEQLARSSTDESKGSKSLLFFEFICINA